MVGEAQLLRGARGGGRRAGGGGRGGLGRPGDRGASFVVVERLEGETIPRRIMRDDEWAGARAAFVAQSAAALARFHRIDPAEATSLRCPGADRSARRPARRPRSSASGVRARPALARRAPAAAGSHRRGPRRLPVRQRARGPEKAWWRCWTGSSPTWAIRWRTWAGSASGPGGSAVTHPSPASVRTRSCSGPTRPPAATRLIRRWSGGGRCWARCAGG